MLRPLIAGLAALTVGGGTVVTVPTPVQPQSAYLVVYREGTDAGVKTTELERRTGFHATHRYESVFPGFAASLTVWQRDAVARDRDVVSLHPDRSVRLVPPERALRQASVATGVARVGGGAHSSTVAVAVLDTGVDASHPDLTVRSGTNCLRPAGRASLGTSDDNGHGTHVAGTIGGAHGTGVAPGTTIYAVKVLDANGGGTIATVVCGVDWVTANAARLGIGVASLSLGMLGRADSDCGRTNGDPLHRAICRSVASGVVYVVAAGNDRLDLARSVPAAYPEVLAVTAMSDTDGAPGGKGPSSACGGPRDRDDAAASFSNFATKTSDAGRVVAAPGVCIRSTWPGGRYATLSGTSMAAPHVAATVALCLGSGRCRGSPAHIAQQVRADAAAHATATNGFTGDERHGTTGRSD